MLAKDLLKISKNVATVNLAQLSMNTDMTRPSTTICVLDRQTLRTFFWGPRTITFSKI